MSGPDFASLMKKPSGEAKKPPPLPGGDYPGVIQGFEHVKSGKKGTPGIQLNLQLQGWPDDVSESDRADSEGVAIDLAKRGKVSSTIWISGEDQMWRLDKALRDDLGMAMGRPYDEVLAELPGTQVIVTIVQRINPETNETGYQVDKVVAV